MAEDISLATQKWSGWALAHSSLDTWVERMHNEKEKKWINEQYRTRKAFMPSDVRLQTTKYIGSDWGGERGGRMEQARWRGEIKRKVTEGCILSAQLSGMSAQWGCQAPSGQFSLSFLARGVYRWAAWGGCGFPWNLIGHPRCHPKILNYDGPSPKMT